MPSKIMMLGDSITELDWQGGFRAYLYKSLSDSGHTFSFTGSRTTNHASPNTEGWEFPSAYWYHEGVGGRAAFQWLPLMPSALTADPEILVMQIGTNDISNGSRSEAQITADIRNMFLTAWERSSTTRIVFSNIINKIEGTLSGSASALSAFQGSITSLNSKFPAIVNDLVSSGYWIQLVDNYTSLSLSSDYTGDGVHPSVAGYKKMRTVFFPAVVSALTASTTTTSYPYYALARGFGSDFRVTYFNHQINAGSLTSGL